MLKSAEEDSNRVQSLLPANLMPRILMLKILLLNYMVVWQCPILSVILFIINMLSLFQSVLNYIQMMLFLKLISLIYILNLMMLLEPLHTTEQMYFMYVFKLLSLRKRQDSKGELIFKYFIILINMLNNKGCKERDLLLDYNNGEDAGFCIPMTHNFLEKQHHIRKEKIAADV